MFRYAIHQTELNVARQAHLYELSIFDKVTRDTNIRPLDTNSMPDPFDRRFSDSVLKIVECFIHFRFDMHRKRYAALGRHGVHWLEKRQIPSGLLTPDSEPHHRILIINVAKPFEVFHYMIHAILPCRIDDASAVYAVIRKCLSDAVSDKRKDILNIFSPQ